MKKEEILGDFLRALKTVFNIATLYSADHPFFTKTVAEFKAKTDNTFTQVSSLKFAIANNYLLSEDITFSGAAIYVDLAKMFHARKLKSIEFKKNVSTKELILFLNKTAAPAKEIFKEGGICAILQKEKIDNIIVEELDYSQLLMGHGSEYKDVWEYLLKSATEKFDLQQINLLADNFGKIIGQFSTKEILGNDETKESIHKLIGYLKGKDKGRFDKCSMEMAKSILNDKHSSDADPEKIKSFFKDLTDENLSVVLGDEIIHNENFDSLSFDFFSKLVQQDRHVNIAKLTEKKLGRELGKASPKTKRRLDELISFSRNSSISKVYRSALSTLLKHSPSIESTFIDRDSLKINYRCIVLNLLLIEENEAALKLLLIEAAKILEELIKEEDFENIKMLIDASNKAKVNNPVIGKNFTVLDKTISAFAENFLINSPGLLSSDDIGYFLPLVTQSSFKIDFYIQKIFTEHQINPVILNLFLTLFPDNLDIFYEKMILRASDHDFLMLIIGNLKGINPQICLEIIKKIFYNSTTMIKIEALRAMFDLPIQDNGFLFEILNDNDMNLKKEALLLLLRADGLHEEAIDSLLTIRSAWGKKNALLIENIQLIEDMRVKEAKSYLLTLSKKPFFWNRDLRLKAKQALSKIQC